MGEGQHLALGHVRLDALVVDLGLLFISGTPFLIRLNTAITP